MPAYSFSMMEFVPLILDGRKAQTIRPKRKRQTIPGDLLTLYYKQRTPNCRAICLTECVKVTPIRIHPYDWVVVMNGRVLSWQKMERLAEQDGFSHVSTFFHFFERYKQRVLKGFEVVEWNGEKLLDLWSVDLFQDVLKSMDVEARRRWLEAVVEVGEELDGMIILDDPWKDKPVDRDVFDKWYEEITKPPSRPSHVLETPKTWEGGTDEVNDGED